MAPERVYKAGEPVGAQVAPGIGDADAVFVEAIPHLKQNLLTMLARPFGGSSVHILSSRFSELSPKPGNWQWGSGWSCTRGNISAASIKSCIALRGSES